MEAATYLHPSKQIYNFLRVGGITSLDRAEAVIEMTEWVEVPKKNLTLENNTTDQTGSAKDSAKDSKEDLSSGSDADNSSNTMMKVMRKIILQKRC
jgi:hypoxia up-regulated 1